MSLYYRPAHITAIDHGGVLTNFINQRPVLTSADMPGQVWRFQPATPSQGDGSIVITLYDATGASQETLALTLSPNGPQAGMVDVVLQKLQNPTPPQQMWTMERAIVPPEFPPPFAAGPICNVANKGLCLGVGGNTPLPPPFTPVAAIQRNGEEDQRWMVSFQR